MPIELISVASSSTAHAHLARCCSCEQCLQGCVGVRGLEMERPLEPWAMTQIIDQLSHTCSLQTGSRSDTVVRTFL